jgi:hypothetical protein
MAGKCSGINQHGSAHELKAVSNLLPDSTLHTIGLPPACIDPRLPTPGHSPVTMMCSHNHGARVTAGTTTGGVTPPWVKHTCNTGCRCRITPCDQGIETCCALAACLPAPRCGSCCGCACPACAFSLSCVSSPSGSFPFCASCCCCAPSHGWTAPCGDASTPQYSSRGRGRQEVGDAVQQTDM